MDVSDPKSNGRDKKSGRFTVGNPGGPGNPFARYVAEHRAAAMSYATADRTQRVMEALYLKAVDGDVVAIKEWLQRTIGNQEALDLLAWMQDLERRLQEQGLMTTAKGPGAATEVA